MFCRNCGKELCEQAYVCPDCGCLVSNVTKAKEETSVIARVRDEMEKKSLLKIFLMISFAFLCAALMFAFFAVVDLGMDINVDAHYSYSYKDIYAYAYGYTFLRTEYVIPACILTLLALGTGIVSFVFGLKEETKESMKLISIFNFMLCVAMTGISIFMLCYI